MKTKRRLERQVAWSFCVLIAIITTGCVSEGTAARSEKGKLLQDAERYVSELKEHERLPGYSSTEHGNVIASAAWHGGDVTYPASVMVRAYKQGDESTYCYALVKHAPESPWRLVEGTRVDKHDKVTEHLFPK